MLSKTWQNGCSVLVSRLRGIFHTDHLNNFAAGPLEELTSCFVAGESEGRERRREEGGGEREELLSGASTTSMAAAVLVAARRLRS